MLQQESDSNDAAIQEILAAYKRDLEIELKSEEESGDEEDGGSDGSVKKEETDDSDDDGSDGDDSKEDIFAQLDDATVGRPRSDREKELMSLVFGGKQELVNNLLGKTEEDDSEQEDKPKRKAAWHDSDDERDEDYRKKKSKVEMKASTKRQRKNFEKIVGQPKWADLDREKEVDSDDEILKTVGHVVKGKSLDLPKGEIELKRLKNLNRETKNEGEITAINFHPTSMVAVMTGKNGLASIVAVDGTKNEKLHTIGLKNFKIACCRMTPDGNEVLFGSYRKFYHVYNLISGASDTLQLKGDGAWTMKNFDMSKCGKYLAVTGGYGEIHLLDARSKELLTTIQQKNCCYSLCFTPDSKYLLCKSR